MPAISWPIAELFRLYQLILETLPFGLVAEQQYDPPLSAADGEDRRSINAVPMPERCRGCGARLAQGLTDPGVPILRHQFMPGPTYEGGDRNLEQLGKRAIGALNPAAWFDDAQRATPHPMSLPTHVSNCRRAQRLSRYPVPHRPQRQALQAEQGWDC